MQSPIQIDLEGLPSDVRACLSPCDSSACVYDVRDGLVHITSVSSEDAPVVVDYYLLLGHCVLALLAAGLGACLGSARFRPEGTAGCLSGRVVLRSSVGRTDFGFQTRAASIVQTSSRSIPIIPVRSMRPGSDGRSTSRMVDRFSVWSFAPRKNALSRRSEGLPFAMDPGYPGRSLVLAREATSGSGPGCRAKHVEAQAELSTLVQNYARPRRSRCVAAQLTTTTQTLGTVPNEERPP